MPKEKKLNLKRTARISVHPCCFSNPRAVSPPYHPLSPPTDYQSAPPSSPNASPPLSPILSSGIIPNSILLTLNTTPPPLTSPPPAPTQPSKHSSPLAISLDLTELLFSTPPTSPQTLFDTLEDLPPTTTNPPPPRPSFDSIERLANDPPPIPAMEPPLPPISTMEPSFPPLPLQLLSFPSNPPSNFPPLPPLGRNNLFPLLTHEMFCEHCQRTQVVVDNLRDEMHFILNHILYQAIIDEMDSIKGNNTWVLADQPPVAHINIIRLLIALASIHNLIMKVDVKETFFNGELDEEVYINQPQGFIMPRVIGYLMYVMTCTRPDIAFEVGKLSRFTSKPNIHHWQAVQ
ncbi:copia protein [Tanacetum coccineum]